EGGDAAARNAATRRRIGRVTRSLTSRLPTRKANGSFASTKGSMALSTARLLVLVTSKRKAPACAGSAGSGRIAAQPRQWSTSAWATRLRMTVVLPVPGGPNTGQRVEPRQYAA